MWPHDTCTAPEGSENHETSGQWESERVKLSPEDRGHDQPIEWETWLWLPACSHSMPDDERRLMDDWGWPQRCWHCCWAGVGLLGLLGLVTTQLWLDWCLKQGFVIKLETFIIIQCIWPHQATTHHLPLPL